MRDRGEVKLLKIRQSLIDALDLVQSEVVINLDKYRILKAKLITLEHLLLLHRKKLLKLKKSVS